MPRKPRWHFQRKICIKLRIHINIDHSQSKWKMLNNAILIIVNRSNPPRLSRLTRRCPVLLKLKAKAASVLLAAGPYSRGEIAVTCL